MEPYVTTLVIARVRRGKISFVPQAEEKPIWKTPPVLAITSSPNEPQIDLPAIIQQWRPLIAKITCEIDTSQGQVYATVGGSGIAMPLLGDPNVVMFATNAHVVNGVSKCEIKLPDDPETFTVADDQNTNFRVSGQLDFGIIRVQNPDQYSKNLISTENGPANNLQFCNKTASLGDSVVILGYPGIGSQTDITATDGIISGYDGNYYITSAKVEHGDSGGAAILVNSNCYLGIPSYVEAGSVESLARILDEQIIFK